MPAPRKPTPTAQPSFSPRLRVLVGDEIALGPGKARLLELVGETGSIAGAASAMGMSYMRAWTLVRTMNRCFPEPVVVSVRGGARRGGARLTPAGREALALYREMESACAAASARPWRRLAAMLAPRGKPRSI